jgi:FAD/FMN-containing dehydrogenase
VLEIPHSYGGVCPRKQEKKNSVQTYMRELQPIQPTEIDREGLAEALAKNIQGEVRFDNGSRALYSTDSSNYRQVPIGVVIPRTLEDVLETVKTARRVGAPILARGGGTSLAGQCCNFGVVIDMSKYLNRILDVDTQKKVARVQPGVVLDQLNREIKQYNLMYGPDPSTHAYCTFGGMIGNNSCGVHSVIAGRTSENIESLDLLTYDGARFHAGKTDDIEFQHIVENGGRGAQIYSNLKALRDRYADAMRQRIPKIPRRSSGYNIDELLPENGFNVARALAGSESTCALVLEATMRLVYLLRAPLSCSVTRTSTAPATILWKSWNINRSGSKASTTFSLRT